MTAGDTVRACDCSAFFALGVLLWANVNSRSPPATPSAAPLATAVTTAEATSPVCATSEPTTRLATALICADSAAVKAWTDVDVADDTEVETADAMLDGGTLTCA